MILLAEDLTFKCDCKREHSVLTKKIIVEAGALNDLITEMKNCGLHGRTTAVFDNNTKQAVKEYDLIFDDEIILSPDDLHADETSTAKVMSLLGETDILVAVGSGTVHDIVRWCANELKIPFVSCPTAASVDGFCSSVSAMTWYGFKKTMPGTAPVLVIADTNILQKAPMRLTRSGLGDMIGKHISLADWKISKILAGEYYCENIAGMTARALDSVKESAGGLISGNLDSYEKLIYGLLLSGISMQLAGNSRPASGAEHHVSHLIEMGTVVKNDALHGEKVGVASIEVSRIYHKLRGLTNAQVSGIIKDYAGIDKKAVSGVYKELSHSIFEENQNDCAAEIDKKVIVENWGKIKEVLSEIPSPEYLKDILLSADAKTDFSDIGILAGKINEIIRYSPLVRNRLTLMRVASGFGLF